MSLILMGSALAGLIASKILQLLSLEPLWLRYSLNVLVSYIFFIIWIKVWLVYISPGRTSNVNVDAPDPGNIGIPDLGSGSSAPDFSGAGGAFGGGGASGDWSPGEAAADAVTSSSSASGGGVDLDLPDLSGADEGIVPILIVAALGFVLVAIFGGAAFLIYQAPAILSDAALQFMLSAGLLKSARNISSAGWVGSIVRRSWIPFSVIALLGAVAGTIIGSYCPGAQKLSEAIQACVL
jgi:hypothetical protein